MKHLFALFILLFFTVPAHAAEPLKVTYGLYASGFNVVEVEGTYTIKDDKYDLSMDLKTAGLLGKMAPWSGLLKTSGVYKKAVSTPIKHSFASTWRNETETKEFAFDADGTLTAATKESNGKLENKMPNKDVYENGAIDTLTAMFRAMNQKSCAGKYDVMDGKRRFDMTFKSKGTATMEKKSILHIRRTSRKV